MIHYLIMGLIQGLTEFLPVSSSGHLVIGERFLRFDPPGVLLEAILHLGTLVAVLILFRRDILRLARGLFTKRREFGEISRLIVGTIPITVIGFVLQDKIDAAFS
ncbi:undecaprenyl-diphosphate phosphatase, partial [Candidatus Bipolaricaulota bacterium]|nr:undecaprenyl-diphosphate phosphatase [Candidatus Bipolaricaulota bacterium]